jgi:hypothetical protein
MRYGSRDKCLFIGIRPRPKRCDKPVSPPSHRFNEHRRVCRFAQRNAESLNGTVQTGVEIDEGVCRPKSVAEFFASNYLAGTLDKHAQDLKRLFLQLQLDSVPSQLTSTNIYLEVSETRNTRELRLYSHYISLDWS